MLYQEVHYVWVSFLWGHMQGRPVHLGAGVPTDPRPEEDLRCLQVTVLGRKVEWGRSQLQTQAIAINESLIPQRPTGHIPPMEQRQYYQPHCEILWYKNVENVEI